MAKRLELHALLELLLGSGNVYFQPPPSHEIEYPCIIYKLDGDRVKHASNKPYLRRDRYLVTYIDHDPDNSMRETLADLPLCSFDRFYTADHLNHYAYNLYF